MTDEVQKQIAGALSNTLGAPSSELGALVADKIRFLRWKNALRTVERARELADACDVSLKQPALKFLVPFLEHCSLEEEDEDIQEFWAQLLVAAGVEFKSGHLLFMRLLREMTGTEARLLRDIATAGGIHEPTPSGLDDAIATWGMFSAPASPLAQMETFSDWEACREKVFNTFQVPGVAIETLELDRLDDDTLGGFASVETSHTYETLFHGHDQVSVDILSSLNVITKIDQMFDKGNDEDSSGEYHRLMGWAYCMTSMGAAFYSEVSGLTRAGRHA